MLEKAALLVDMFQKARAAGKDWWVDLEIRSIEASLWQDKKIKALEEALMVVRDAENDCKLDGLPGAFPVPPMVLAKIDKALAMVAVAVDPDAPSFAAFLANNKTQAA